jgi:hypothetical protein
VIYSSQDKTIIPDLLAHRANPNLRNEQGQMARDLAEGMDLSGTVQLLKQGIH